MNIEDQFGLEHLLFEQDESFVDKDGDRWYTDEYGDRSYMWDYR